LCEGVQSILVWQNEKSNMLNQRFLSHSEEDIRISQSEAFSSGGPIREKIDKRTFTLV